MYVLKIALIWTKFWKRQPAYLDSAVNVKMVTNEWDATFYSKPDGYRLNIFWSFGFNNKPGFLKSCPEGSLPLEFSSNPDQAHSSDPRLACSGQVCLIRALRFEEPCSTYEISIMSLNLLEVS